MDFSQISNSIPLLSKIQIYELIQLLEKELKNRNVETKIKELEPIHQITTKLLDFQLKNRLKDQNPKSLELNYEDVAEIVKDILSHNVLYFNDINPKIGLFSPLDNIRYCYIWNNWLLPEWFRTKYNII